MAETQLTAHALPPDIEFLDVLPGLAAGQWSPAERDRLNASDAKALALWLEKQELAAFAYGRLKKAEMAPALVSALAPAYWQQVAAAELKLQLLVRILEALAARSVTAVALKGIAYGLTLYDEPAQRPMNDIDLWLQPAALAPAWEALTTLDLQAKGLWPDVAAIPAHVTQLDFYPESPQHAAYSVELHWDLSQRATVRGRLPLARWWGQRQPSAWEGCTVPVLAPAAALVHACVHQMLEHRGELRWRWLLDIDQLVRGKRAFRLEDGDWQQVLLDTRQAGVLPAVQEALQVVFAELGTPLPPAARVLLDADADAADIARVTDLTRTDRSVTGKVFLNASYAEGWRQKTAVVQHILFPRTDYMIQRYEIRHRALLPAYYVGRLLKGAGMAVTGWWHQRRRNS